MIADKDAANDSILFAQLATVLTRVSDPIPTTLGHACMGQETGGDPAEALGA